MSPDQILGELRTRFRVPPEYAERFLPLVRRALSSAPAMRERILELVEGTFAREARRLEGLRAAAGQDADVLSRVAQVLDRWEPPAWLLAFGEGPGEIPPPHAPPS